MPFPKTNEPENHRYFLVNKPRNMVSQFVSSHDVPLLGDLDFAFPPGTHAIGRLDRDSEGLLILTTDKTVTRKLFLADTPHTRSYLVMLQNEMTDATLLTLQHGIDIKVKNGDTHTVKALDIRRVDASRELYPFAADPREIYPHTWLLITLTEGKFHQVRKMVLAVRHRCLRLVRISISNILLGDLPSGKIREINAEDFYNQLQQKEKTAFL